MKKTLFLILLLAVGIAAHAERTTIETPKGAVSVEFLSPRIVHVVKTQKADSPVAASLVVTMKPEAVAVKRTEAAAGTTLSSRTLSVSVDAKTGRVTFRDRQGETLLAEGDWQLTPLTTALDKGCVRAKANFQLDKDEPIYGIGLMENHKMNQRGEHRRMMQSNLEDFQNVFQSLKGYALFWDNYSPTQIDDTPEQGLTLDSEVGDAISYYFMYGQSADGNIALIRQLSGDVPMLPLWSYGFWQSRERYKSQKELTEVVDKYRQLGVPLDGIIMDWQYWDSNYLWNAMEFLNPEFPKAKDMIDHVHQQNVHFAISIWQSFGPHTKAFREMNDRGLLFNFETWPQSGLPTWPPRMDYPSGVRVYKPYTEEARDIYWKHLTRLFDLGCDVWWMDSTDPDHHSYKESDLDEEALPGTSYRKVRNAFPLACVQGVYEHQRQATDQKRAMILTRSGFAGQQRYASNVWTGDVRSDWPTLRNQIPMLLNFSLTGNPHTNTDIGGFFSGSYNRSYGDNASGARNPQFQELYVRWMQFGAFCPMMRSHGTETYRELYYFGKAGEPVYDALTAAIKLRYRMLPYIYSTAWDVTRNRGTFMRALWMDFADDAQTHDMKDEFLFGRNLLVAPIVEAQYTPEKRMAFDEMSGWNRKEGTSDGPQTGSIDFTQTKSTTVYLPKMRNGENEKMRNGTRYALGSSKKWYDFWTGKVYDGGQQMTLPSTISTIPLFVRAGSIIPLGGDIQSTADRDWSQLELRVYPGADGQFTLYEDDGETYDYEKGAYTEIPITWNDKRRTLSLGKRLGNFAGAIESRQFSIVLPDGTQKTVTYKGKAVQVKL